MMYCKNCSCKSCKPPLWKHYEYHHRSSHKFWEARRDGSKVWVRFGPSGATGQTLMKECYTSWDAQDYMDQKIEEKLNKGYYQT